MIPLYVERDMGTCYMKCWVLNPLALYLIACGWQVGTFVLPSAEQAKEILNKFLREVNNG